MASILIFCSTDAFAPASLQFCDAVGSLKMASVAPPQLVLVDKENSRSAVWKHFAFEASEQGKTEDPSEPV